MMQRGVQLSKIRPHGYRVSLVDVLISQGGWTAIPGHELISGVDAHHVVHDTKGEIRYNPRCVVHELSDGVHEVVHFLLGTLGAAIEVLACKFRDPDGSAERIVPVRDISNEILGPDVIPMNGDTVESAAITTIEELRHPDFSVRIGGSSGRNQVVALILEGLYVLLPQTYTLLRGHVGLAGFIGLVHSKDGVSIACMDKLLEAFDLMETPKHGKSLQTEVPGALWNVWAPCVDV